MIEENQEEDLQKNIELIEEEKEEYLENNSEEDKGEGVEEEEINVEETEFSLTREEIEEWIVKLTELKVEKNPIELEVDEEMILKINYDGEEE